MIYSALVKRDMPPRTLKLALHVQNPVNIIKQSKLYSIGMGFEKRGTCYAITVLFMCFAFLDI